MSAVRRPRTQREYEIQADEKHAEDSQGFLPEEDQPLLATNTGVRLACTMAAMLSPFALFLCWEERESRVIRRFAVQSAALTAIHLLGGAVLGLLSLLVGNVPYFGFLMTLMGWLFYIAVALVTLFLRIRLMERAWRGRKFTLPLIERLICRFY